MALPDSYTLKPKAIPEYFAAIKQADPPERFSSKFLENLGFPATNDRNVIAILKELGFLDSDGVPQERYYRFLDNSISGQVLAEGIREAYSDLFAVNTDANRMTTDDVKNKLKTLYQGKKSENQLNRISRTFTALCAEADWTAPAVKKDKTPEPEEDKERKPEPPPTRKRPAPGVALDSLQYHINIVLPESRDQAVFDAIFASLRAHLG